MSEPRHHATRHPTLIYRELRDAHAAWDRTPPDPYRDGIPDEATRVTDLVGEFLAAMDERGMVLYQPHDHVPRRNLLKVLDNPLNLE